MGLPAQSWPDEVSSRTHSQGLLRWQKDPEGSLDAASESRSTGIYLTSVMFRKSSELEMGWRPGIITQSSLILLLR